MDFSHFQFSFLLDTVPVVLAIIALKGLYGVQSNNSMVYLARAACVLLIICQLTWIHSYLAHFPLINSLIDNLWTIFNSVVMLMIIVLVDYLKISTGRRKTDKTNRQDRVTEA